MRSTMKTISLSFGAILLLSTACGGNEKKETTTPKKYMQRAGDASGGEAAPAKTDETPAKAETPAPAPAPAPAATPEDPPASGGFAAQNAPPPRAEVQQAMAMVRRGRYLDAIRQAKAALKRSEKYTPAMEVMGRAYFHLGKNEFAEAICDTAIGLDPNSGACYNIKGHIALKQENAPLALKHFKKATEVAPNLGAPWLNLGALYLRVKNYSAAEPVLEKAVSLLGSRAEAHLNLGAAYRGTGKIAKAMQSLQQALKLRANYAPALFNLGILYLDAKEMPGMNKMQQLAKAESYLRQYKNYHAARNKADPVDTYLEAVEKAVKREQRRIKREERKRKREERRKAREAAKKAEGAKQPEGGK